MRYRLWSPWLVLELDDEKVDSANTWKAGLSATRTTREFGNEKYRMITDYLI